jgi:hypothetical protein
LSISGSMNMIQEDDYWQGELPDKTPGAAIRLKTRLGHVQVARYNGKGLPKERLSQGVCAGSSGRDRDPGDHPRRSESSTSRHRGSEVNVPNSSLGIARPADRHAPDKQTGLPTPAQADGEGYSCCPDVVGCFLGVGGHNSFGVTDGDALVPFCFTPGTRRMVHVSVSLVVALFWLVPFMSLLAIPILWLLRKWAESLTIVLP